MITQKQYNNSVITYSSIISVLDLTGQ